MLGSRHGQDIEALHGVSYVQVAEAVRKVAFKWGDNKLLEPSWSPVEWEDAFFEAFEQPQWDGLTSRDQNQILAFLQDEQLSSDVYSANFPSVPRFHDSNMKVNRNHKPGDGRSWLRDQTAIDMSEWFGIIKENLEKRRYSDDALRYLMRRCLEDVLPVEVSVRYHRQICGLLDVVERWWDQQGDGTLYYGSLDVDDAKKS
ncbi:hypothetical protein JCM16303_006709 [Sporobolomyces ruberrimus]